MDLLSNPFYLLGATPRDQRHRLVELADALSSPSDAEALAQARADLTNMRRRLAAEVAWLPGIAPNRSEALVAAVRSGGATQVPLQGLTALGRANVAAAVLSRFGSNSGDDIHKWILQLAECYEAVTPGEVIRLINEDRQVGGFPEVVDPATVDAELAERRVYFRSVIRDALDQLPTVELVDLVTRLVESVTQNGEHAALILIDDLIDRYEIDAQAFLEPESRNVGRLADEIRAAIASPAGPKKIDTLLERFESLVQKWDWVAQPIQLSMKSRGLQHGPTHEVATLVRSLVIDLYNDHDRLDLAKRLTLLQKRVFGEDYEISEQMEKDLTHLERATVEKEEFAQEIAYRAEIGGFFSRHLIEFSTKGIEWQHRLWPFETLSRIRWGGTRFSSSTEMKIAFGNLHEEATITTGDEDVFRAVSGRLWKAVGLRLVGELLSSVSKGERCRFGLVEVEDAGLHLPRVSGYAKSTVFCPWRELSVGSESGTLVIQSVEDKRLVAELSYQDQDNVHVLEAVLRAFLKHPGERLSDLMRG